MSIRLVSLLALTSCASLQAEEPSKSYNPITINTEDVLETVQGNRVQYIFDESLSIELKFEGVSRNKLYIFNDGYQNCYSLKFSHYLSTFHSWEVLPEGVMKLHILIPKLKRNFTLEFDQTVKSISLDDDKVIEFKECNY